MQAAYLCHPYGSDPVANSAECARLAKLIADTCKGELLPIVPQIYFERFIDETTQRELAMEYCVSLMRMCNIVIVYGSTLSAGMRQELNAMRSAQDVWFVVNDRELLAKIKPYVDESRAIPF